MRNNISDFEFANPPYAGATVTIYTVSGGVKTTTRATLYKDLTSSDTLLNPQQLDSKGMFQQPVYVDVPVVITVSGLTIPDHDTGVLNAVLDSLADASSMHAAATKATPVDADEFTFLDSASAFSLAKATWANIKTVLLAYFSALTGTWAISTTGNAATATDAADHIADASAAHAASAISNTPAGNISATNVQAAINESDGDKAALAGSATQVFDVEAATASAHAVRLDQLGVVSQNSQSTAYTAVLADGYGKHILHPSADTTARVFTIPANSSVAYPIGTVLTFVNQNGAGVITIAITTDTMRLAGAGTTGSRTLAANGVASAIKLTATEWIISGTGLT